MVPVCEKVGERSEAKSYRPVSLLSVVSKIFDLWLVISKTAVFFLTFRMVSVWLLVQQQIFGQLYLIKLLGLSIALGLLEL